MIRPLAVLPFLVTCGCGQNAILEAELDLPPAGEQPLRAFVQARSGGDFEDEWDDGAPSAEWELAPAERTEQVVSVDASGGDLRRELLLRIRYCDRPPCATTDGAPPREVRVRIERAFYEGRFTSVALEELPLPCEGCTPADFEVSRCEVAGCRGGRAIWYCTENDTHFCE